MKLTTELSQRLQDKKTLTEDIGRLLHLGDDAMNYELTALTVGMLEALAEIAAAGASSEDKQGLTAAVIARVVVAAFQIGVQTGEPGPAGDLSAFAEFINQLEF